MCYYFIASNKSDKGKKKYCKKHCLKKRFLTNFDKK